MKEQQEKTPTRKSKATPLIRQAAILSYVLEQEDPQIYPVLLMIKAYKHLKRYTTKERLCQLLNISEKDMDERLDRLRERGLVAVQDGYINSTRAGEVEFMSVLGRVSYYVEQIESSK